jgi:hypothetical protein
MPKPWKSEDRDVILQLVSQIKFRADSRTP